MGRNRGSARHSERGSRWALTDRRESRRAAECSPYLLHVSTEILIHHYHAETWRSPLALGHSSCPTAGPGARRPGRLSVMQWLARGKEGQSQCRLFALPADLEMGGSPRNGAREKQ